MRTAGLAALADVAFFANSRPNAGASSFRERDLPNLAKHANVAPSARTRARPRVCVRDASARARARLLAALISLRPLLHLCNWRCRCATRLGARARTRRVATIPAGVYSTRPRAPRSTLVAHEPLGLRDTLRHSPSTPRLGRRHLGGVVHARARKPFSKSAAYDGEAAC